jgi:hypothetical protein
MLSRSQPKLLRMQGVEQATCGSLDGVWDSRSETADSDGNLADCFPGSPSCWHCFRGQGCVWQVLLVGLHSTWGFQKHLFLSSTLIYALGGTWF